METLDFEKAKTLVSDIQEVLAYKDAVQLVSDFLLWELKPEEIRTFSIHYKLWSDEKETENPWDDIIAHRLTELGLKPNFYWAEVEVNAVVIPFILSAPNGEKVKVQLVIHKDFIEITDQIKLLKPPTTNIEPAFEIEVETAKQLRDYFNEP